MGIDPTSVDQAWQPAVAALRQVLKDHGRRLSEDPVRLRAAMNDVLGSTAYTHRANVDAIVVAAEEGIAGDLLATTGEAPSRSDAQLESAMSARGFVASTAAAVRAAWAAALGVERAPSGPASPGYSPAPPVARDGASLGEQPTVIAGSADAMAGAGTPWGSADAQQPVQPPSSRAGVLVALALVVLALVVGVAWHFRANGDANIDLSAPQHVKASGGPAGVEVSWDAVAGADHYDVFRDSALAASSKGLSVVDSRSDNASHSYVVRAVGISGTSGPGSAPASAAARPKLSDAEAALASHLPATTADESTCRSNPAAEHDNIDASVSCDPGTSTAGAVPLVVVAYHYVDGVTQVAEAQRITSTVSLPTQQCKDAPASTTWNLQNETVARGYLLCYMNADQKAVVSWDYNDEQVTIRAVAADNDIAGLITWWGAAASALS